MDLGGSWGSYPGSSPENFSMFIYSTDENVILTHGNGGTMFPSVSRKSTTARVNWVVFRWKIVMHTKTPFSVNEIAIRRNETIYKKIQQRINSYYNHRDANLH